jgi:hypothetical protein
VSPCSIKGFLIQSTGITERGVGVIYVSEPTDQSSNRFDLEPIMLSPVIVRAAKAIYQTYVQTHGNRQTPIGIAIDRYTYRGQPIFGAQPILLPHECFVPLKEIDRLDTDDSADSAEDLES